MHLHHTNITKRTFSFKVFFSRCILTEYSALAACAEVCVTDRWRREQVSVHHRLHDVDVDGSGMVLSGGSTKLTY